MSTLMATWKELYKYSYREVSLVQATSSIAESISLTQSTISAVLVSGWSQEMNTSIVLNVCTDFNLLFIALPKTGL